MSFRIVLAKSPVPKVDLNELYFDDLVILCAHWAYDSVIHTPRHDAVEEEPQNAEFGRQELPGT